MQEARPGAPTAPAAPRFLPGQAAQRALSNNEGDRPITFAYGGKGLEYSPSGTETGHRHFHKSARHSTAHLLGKRLCLLPGPGWGALALLDRHADRTNRQTKGHGHSWSTEKPSNGRAGHCWSPGPRRQQQVDASGSLLPTAHVGGDAPGLREAGLCPTLNPGKAPQSCGAQPGLT